MAVELRGVGRVFADIFRACEWYSRIGVPLSGTRLELIRSHIENRLLDTTTPEAFELEALTPRAETYYALTDGAAFSLIAEKLSSLPSNLLPRRALRDILRGPFVPTDETHVSSEGRNKFVELELAAHLSSVGFDLKGFDDVKFEFEGTRYIVECKRPFREATLASNVDSAYRQLRKKLASPEDRGIIAIAVDKMFDLDQRVIDMGSHASASALAELISRKLLARVEHYQAMWIDPRIVGFFAVIRFIAKTEKPRSFGPSYNLALLIIATPQAGQKADFEKLLRMTERIQSGFEKSRKGTT